MFDDIVNTNPAQLINRWYNEYEGEDRVEMLRCDLLLLSAGEIKELEEKFDFFYNSYRIDLEKYFRYTKSDPGEKSFIKGYLSGILLKSFTREELTVEEIQRIIEESRGVDDFLLEVEWSLVEIPGMKYYKVAQQQIHGTRYRS